MNIIEKQIENYVKKNTKPSTLSLLEQVEHTTKTSTAIPQMLSGRVVGRLLKLLAKLSKAKYILEIGTFTGYSTLCLAEGLEKSGMVYTCEIDHKTAMLAQSHFNQSPYAKNIKLLIGPALEQISKISKNNFDLIFIDADKINYPTYYEQSLNLLRPNGIMIIDNCLWSGSVLNPQDESSKAIADLNKTISQDLRVENVFLTVRDGLQVVMKKS
jgi:caffeoyl-CoA O-methyltransferase